jgi:hypothetical protein
MININLKLHKQSNETHVKIQCYISFILLSLEINEIIKKIKEEFREVALKCIEEFLKELDNIIVKEELKEHEIIRFYNRSLLTSLGEVVFRCRQTLNGITYSIPLLDYIGIKDKRRITGECIGEGVKSCLFTTFRKALVIGGMSYCLSTLWKEFQVSGINLRYRYQEIVKYYEAGKEDSEILRNYFAIVMVDGIWIKLQPEKKEKGKSYKKKRVKKKEVKCARLVIGVKDNSGQMHWNEPIVYSSFDRSKKFIKDCSKFFNIVAQLDKIPNILVISDGASMGKNFAKAYPETAHWQLDWWHLWKKVRQGCSIMEGLYEHIWDLLNGGALDEAIKDLENISQQATTYKELLTDKVREIKDFQKFNNLKRTNSNWWNRKIQFLQDLISYLKNQKDGIYGVKGLLGKVDAKYWLWGSGPVERLQAVMIAHRMKGHGKMWSNTGGENMISQLSYFWNGTELQDYMEEIFNIAQLWNNDELYCNSQKKSQHRSNIIYFPAQGRFPLLNTGKNQSDLHTLFTNIQHTKPLDLAA